MSPLRPDLVAVWILRHGRAGRQLLLLRRAHGRLLPGLWQCVTGSLEPDERVAAAALRELVEETGIQGEAVEAFYDLDLAYAFHEPSRDAVLLEAAFAVRVTADTEPRLSAEHDAFRWLTLEEAREVVVWPAYREALGRLASDLGDPERARWFELTPDGLERRIR
jgi:dATP pyrophosphohydrolase